MILKKASSKEDAFFIEDRTGERWNVTQAESAGFKPEWFQYKIGKNARVQPANRWT